MSLSCSLSISLLFPPPHDRSDWKLLSWKIDHRQTRKKKAAKPPRRMKVFHFSIISFLWFWVDIEAKGNEQSSSSRVEFFLLSSWFVCLPRVSLLRMFIFLFRGAQKGAWMMREFQVGRWKGFERVLIRVLRKTDWCILKILYIAMSRAALEMSQPQTVKPLSQPSNDECRNPFRMFLYMFRSQSAQGEKKREQQQIYNRLSCLTRYSSFAIFSEKQHLLIIISNNFSRFFLPRFGKLLVQVEGILIYNFVVIRSTGKTKKFIIFIFSYFLFAGLNVGCGGTEEKAIPRYIDWLHVRDPRNVLLNIFRYTFFSLDYASKTRWILISFFVFVQTFCSNIVQFRQLLLFF